MRNIFLLGLSLFAVLEMQAQGTMLLRQPTLTKKDVVFIYANDLWKAPVAGGDAIRLTSGMGYEMAPHFSPDEQYIAFTAEYDGNYDMSM